MISYVSSMKKGKYMESELSGFEVEVVIKNVVFGPKAKSFLQCNVSL